MSYSGIIQEIKRKVARVPKVGKVHDYRRATPDDEAILTLLKQKGEIRGFFLTRIAAENEQASNVECERRHTIAFYGYKSYRDSRISELDFQTLLDNIMDEFSPQDFDLKEFCELVLPVSFHTIDFMLVGGTLCHFAYGTMIVQEFGRF